MAKVTEASEREKLSVATDPAFERDLKAAKERTGIRSDSDLVRHAVRMLAVGR